MIYTEMMKLVELIKDELFKQYFKYKINYMIDNNIPNHHLDILRVKYDDWGYKVWLEKTGEEF
jgi:hypothetical protein